ncbi:MAG: BON domain-containing protein [Pseudomonadota bacterium]
MFVFVGQFTMTFRSFLLVIAGLVCFANLPSCASSRTLGSSIDDLESNATLKRVLFTDRSHDYGDVDLTLYEGRLLLTGTMASEDGRRKLIENAWRAESVDQVIDEIFVGDKTPFGQGLTDSRVDAALRTKLITDKGVSSGSIKIAVSNGVVYLLGTARDRDQLERVVGHARGVGGASKVVSHVLYLDNPARQL